MVNSASVDVVVPVFDEGWEICEVVSRLCHVFHEHQIQLTVIVVVDGPDEATQKAALSLMDRGIDVVILPTNVGKGGAVRAGLLRCTSPFVGYIDGDLDIDPLGLISAAQLLSDDRHLDVGFVYGSKHHPEAQISYPVVRRALSALYRQILRRLFALNVQDVQTGLKLFRLDAVSPVVMSLRENGFLLDLELIYLLTRRGWRGLPVPVSINFQYTSTIGLSSLYYILLDTIRLYLRFHSERSKQQPAGNS